MATLRHHTTCSLISGQNGDLQVVHNPTSPTLLIDVQSATRNVFGDVSHAHAVLTLGFGAVCELRALLDQIDEPIDPRQPALPAIWSEATITQPMRPAVVRNRRRKAAVPEGVLVAMADDPEIPDAVAAAWASA